MADLNDRLGPPTPGRDLDARLSGGDLPANIDELEKLKGQEDPSFLDELLDVPTLLKLGLTAAGALSGNRDLQGLAAGFGMGTLGQVGTDVAEAEAKRLKQIDDLTKLVEKQQQRLTTLLQSQPGMFVDEDGQPVEGATEKELAALTGLGVELSPAAMLNRAEATRNKEKVWAIQGALFEQALASGNEEVAAQHLATMFNSVKIPTTAEEAGKLLALSIENVPGVLAQRADLSSVVELMTWSEQNDKPWWHPDAPKLRPKIDVSGGVEGLMVQRADEGIAKIIETMERLKNSSDPADVQQWREYVNQPFKQIEILNNDPKLSRAVKKVYASDRTGEEILLTTLRYMNATISDPNTIAALTNILSAKTPEARSAAVGELFKSLYGQTGQAFGAMALDAESRRIRSMTDEEYQDEFGGEGQ